MKRVLFKSVDLALKYIEVVGKHGHLDLLFFHNKVTFYTIKNSKPYYESYQRWCVRFTCMHYF